MPSVNKREFFIAAFEIKPLTMKSLKSNFGLAPYHFIGNFLSLWKSENQPQPPA